MENVGNWMCNFPMITIYSLFYRVYCSQNDLVLSTIMLRKALFQLSLRCNYELHDTVSLKPFKVAFTANGSLPDYGPDANWIHGFIVQVVQITFINANFKQTTQIYTQSRSIIVGTVRQIKTKKNKSLFLLQPTIWST